MHAHKERPEGGSVYARNEAMKDVFARCLKKTTVQVFQVCTLIILIVILYPHVFTFMFCLFDYSVLDYLLVITASRESDL
jgi:hypothetical protein